MSGEDYTWDLGIDVDGVLYDFIAAFRLQIAGRNDPLMLPEATIWEFHREWGLTYDEFLHHYTDGIVNGRLLWDGEPYPGTQRGWEALVAAGHRLHVITDRNPPNAQREAIEATLHWLELNGMKPTSITFTADKTEILNLARDPKRTAAVDDRRENVRALREAGVLTYVVSRPWNEGVEGPRVESFQEFAALVNAVSRRVN